MCFLNSSILQSTTSLRKILNTQQSLSTSFSSHWLRPVIWMDSVWIQLLWNKETNRSQVNYHIVLVAMLFNLEKKRWENNLWSTLFSRLSDTMAFIVNSNFVAGISSVPRNNGFIIIHSTSIIPLKEDFLEQRHCHGFDKILSSNSRMSELPVGTTSCCVWIEHHFLLVY